MIKAHPQTLSGAIEEQGQEDWNGTAKYDEGGNRHRLAGGQGDGNNHNQEFAHDQVHGHGPRIIARLAFKNEATHRAALIGLKDTGEDLSPATHRAALAQPPSHQ